MADIKAYFKLAASNIRNAVQLKRQQIDNLRREIDKVEREAGQHTTQKQGEIREYEAIAARADADKDFREVQMEKAETLRIINSKHNDIVNKQHEVNHIREALSNNIRNIEKDISELERQANHLQTKT